MISGINSDNNNIEQSIFQPQISQRQSPAKDTPEQLNFFGDEDEAIISAEAQLLNELDKFNSGEGDAVGLMKTCVTSEFTVSAEVNAINAKKNMFNVILGMGE